jgi:hypothetical protein
MPTPLKNGENYLFFPKGHYTGGKVAGFTNAEVAVICTHRYIFIAPRQEFTTYVIASRVKRFEFGEGVPVHKGLENMLKDPQLTLEQLEEDMKQLLGADDHDRVIEVAQLKHFKVHLLWILSQARMKHNAGGAVKTLSLAKPSNMKIFKAFYFPKGA